MDADRERFLALLAEYAALTGAKGPLEPDENDIVTVDAGDGTMVNVCYRASVREVRCFATVGFLPSGREAEILHRALMRTGRGGMGFAYSLQPGTDRLVTHDSRPLGYFTDATVLAAWIEACIENASAFDDGGEGLPASADGAGEVIIWS